MLTKKLPKLSKLPVKSQNFHISQSPIIRNGLIRPSLLNYDLDKYSGRNFPEFKEKERRKRIE